VNNWEADKIKVKKEREGKGYKLRLRLIEIKSEIKRLKFYSKLKCVS
jgi:hypothetical protein